jgi:hypothetical protein
MNHGEIVGFLWGVADLIRDTPAASLVSQGGNAHGVGRRILRR